MFQLLVVSPSLRALAHAILLVVEYNSIYVKYILFFKYVVGLVAAIGSKINEG